uniref:Uncharacterized protein n=1 Tax=Siphoviridae sp. ctnMR5 TaxID=2825658 RepID=A0A8S5U8T9_9CAUD|nr:MAG TPA: hypothetical protein [Siphoviridae sp. ctnMR5]
MEREKQNIQFIYCGSGYSRKDGTSQASKAAEKFKSERPNAKRYTGDLRREKTHFKAVYKLMYFASTMRGCSNFATVFDTYVEE